MTDAVKMAIERIKARFHPHYGIDGASDSKQLASDCQTLISALEQAGEPVAPKVMLSLVEARRIVDALVEHCRGADFSCDMKAATKDVMRLVNVDMRLCRHQAQPGISRSQRPDLQAWQDAQSEYFDDTIIGIVMEYAEWRDAQQPTEAPLPTLQRLGQEFDAGEGLEPGHVQWHSSEEDGDPDVGIMIGLGGGKELWLGELLDIEGGGMGFSVYGPEKIAVASLSDWDEVRDIIEQHIAPALAHPPQSHDTPVEKRKCYLHEWTPNELLSGRISGLKIDAGEIWKYSHTDTDDDGEYDLFCRPQSRGQAFDGEGEGFAIGDPVEKFTGEAIWHGVIVASYLTTKGKHRYVVEVEPQGFQMIAVPTQLRALAASQSADRYAMHPDVAASQKGDE